MIVCKFGGTSLADAKQIRRAVSILLADVNRRVMVVSAPGKRFPDDIKMTDQLIRLADASIQKKETEELFQAVITRFDEIARDLGLDSSPALNLASTLAKRLRRTDLPRKQYSDQIVAFGETCSARLITAYLNHIGENARFIDPLSAGLLLHDDHGHTVIRPNSLEKLGNSLQPEKERLIFPGFYGGDENGNILTFSRGGSDISGAIVAAAIDADLYENWSDVDYVYAVNPNLIKNPCPIREMSYREMRELAYIGFTILHPDALAPVFEKRIPIQIRNTDRPEGEGTRIVHKVETMKRLVTGIAASDNFCTVSLEKVLSNRQVGFLARILTIFADEDILIEHVPTGIDTISIVMREYNFPPEKEAIVLNRLRSEMQFSNITVARDLSAVMLVGEGMLDSITVISRAANALASQKISTEVLLQDYYEISILFMMSKSERERAVPALYDEFFSNCPEVN